MKRTLLAVFASLFLFACSSLPALAPLGSEKSGIETCRAPFITEKRQYVHSISANMPGGNSSQVTGVTTVFPERRAVHAVLLTLEGLVLFNGVIEGERVEVQRAVPPFSTAGFAEGLLGDVKQIFLPPAGIPETVGWLDSNEIVCRYRGADAEFMDLILSQNGAWQLVQYDSGLDPVKWIAVQPDLSGRGSTASRTPFRIQLTTQGVFGYSLEMQLVDEVGF